MAFFCLVSEFWLSGSLSGNGEDLTRSILPVQVEGMCPTAYWLILVNWGVQPEIPDSNSWTSDPEAPLWDWEPKYKVLKEAGAPWHWSRGFQNLDCKQSWGTIGVCHDTQAQAEGLDRPNMPGRTRRGPAFDEFLASGLYKKAIRKFFLVNLMDLWGRELQLLNVIVSFSVVKWLYIFCHPFDSVPCLVSAPLLCILTQGDWIDKSRTDMLLLERSFWKLSSFGDMGDRDLCTTGPVAAYCDGSMMQAGTIDHWHWVQWQWLASLPTL